MRNFEYESFVPGLAPREFYELTATSYRYYTAYHIFLPLHLLCAIFAANMLLRRVSDHASHSYYNVVRDNSIGRVTDSTGRVTLETKFDWRDCIGQYALYYWVRSMHVIAMVICSLNVAARIVAAGFTAKEAEDTDKAAAATDAKTGSETESSRGIWKSLRDDPNQEAFILVSRVLECAALLLVLSGFLLFFPAIIVMFRRVERKLNVLILEMGNRSDVGTAFLPFEFSPRAADGSETQKEMPIVEVRAYLRDIKASAAAQRWRFLFCLVLVAAALLVLASHALFIASFVSAVRNPNSDCGQCHQIGRAHV